MDRRAVLRRCGAALVLAFDGIRGTKASSSLTAPKSAWDALNFDYSTPAKTFPGIAIRLADQRLYVACRICPHQGCTFTYQENYESVGDIVGKDFSNPVLFCPCHLSVFDPTQNGKVLNGPAPRPPWTFSAEEVDGVLRITAIEKGAGDIN